jgi:hypothetical protein
MTARKTVAVESLRERVNGMLADSVPEYTQARTALSVLLEGVLMDSGNYKGYRYTDLSDETRRHYY